MRAQESVSLLGKTLKTPISAFGDLYQGIFYGRDYERIAKAITDPRGVDALEKLAKAGKDRKKIALAMTEFQQIVRALDEEQQ
jgi:hypothetical protein